MSIKILKKITYNLFVRIESALFKIYLIVFKASFLNFIFTKFKGINNIYIGNNCEFGANVSIEVISGGKIVIEDDVIIYPFVKIGTYGGDIIIKRGTVIHSFCVFYGYAGIIIGEKCGIATSSIFVGGNHKYKNANELIWEQGIYGRGIKVGDAVWIGSGSRILSGSIIGDGAVIGAGSIITKEVPINGVAYGNAAVVRNFRGDKN